MQYSKYQEFMAEMFGTMFILLFGNGVNAMVSLFNLGGYTNITFGWGLGVFLGILVSNPSTNFCRTSIFRRLPWIEDPHTGKPSAFGRSFIDHRSL